MLRFLATVVLTACIAAPGIADPNTDDSVEGLLTWIQAGKGGTPATKAGLTMTCQKDQDVAANCKTSDAANCGANAFTDSKVSCGDMCDKFGQTYSCSNAALKDAMTTFIACCATECDVAGNPVGNERNKCVKDTCIVDSTAKMVDDWVEWATAPNGGVDDTCSKNNNDETQLESTCSTNAPKPTSSRVKRSVYDKNSGKPNWDAMCKELGANYVCGQSKTDSMTACCTACPDFGENVSDQVITVYREDCCIECIQNSKPPPTTTATTAPGPATGKTTTPAPTTAKPPAPGPGPTSDTTTMESTSTEEGGSDDSAFPLGPSGLLVTFITMMAAVVNIA